jgi:ADP-ribose pyrophosphatase
MSQAGDRREYQIIEHHVAYQGFFRLERYRLRHTLFRGGWSGVMTRELFERGHAAAVLPYDPRRDEVLLLEQFRIGALGARGGPWLVETVAGIIEPGEDAEQVVRREAVEESGCPVSDLVRICEYHVSPGGTSERITLYCGRVDAAGAGGVHGLDEEHEDIRVLAVPFGEAMTMVADGRIDSATPIIALQWLALNRGGLRRNWLGRT